MNSNLCKRKNMRLKNYNYSQNGAYFITICIKDRVEFLWNNNVGANSVRPNKTYSLSKYGLIIEKSIISIPKYYSNVSIDKYVIMPNHIHLILIINNSCGRTMFAPTISQIIKHFKEKVTKDIGFSLWQRSFHDHIIRNEIDYKIISEYIDLNPLRWENDCYFKPLLI